MTTDNEYAVTDDDLKGGGGGTAKPRGVYTGQISKAKSQLDKNKKPYLGFGIKITHGKYKNGLIFENYLRLDRAANGFQTARRNSFFKAIALKAGSIPHGAPGGPDAELLDGTYVNVTLEHRFEQVPGEDYAIVTSGSPKQPWKADGWDKCLDEQGRLYKNPGGDVFDAPVSPKEEVTFYQLSDEFAGIGDPDAVPDGPDVPDEDSWG